MCFFFFFCFSFFLLIWSLFATGLMGDVLNVLTVGIEIEETGTRTVLTARFLHDAHNELISCVCGAFDNTDAISDAVQVLEYSSYSVLMFWMYENGILRRAWKTICVNVETASLHVREMGTNMRIELDQESNPLGFLDTSSHKMTSSILLHANRRQPK